MYYEEKLEGSREGRADRRKNGERKRGRNKIILFHVPIMLLPRIE